MTKLQPISVTSPRLTGCQPPTRGDGIDEIPRDLCVTPGSVRRPSEARRAADHVIRIRGRSRRPARDEPDPLRSSGFPRLRWQPAGVLVHAGRLVQSSLHRHARVVSRTSTGRTGSTTGIAGSTPAAPVTCAASSKPQTFTPPGNGIPPPCTPIMNGRWGWSTISCCACPNRHRKPPGPGGTSGGT